MFFALVQSTITTSLRSSFRTTFNVGEIFGVFFQEVCNIGEICYNVLVSCAFSFIINYEIFSDESETRVRRTKG
ncbi:hypothetical protein DXU93_00325 [Brumimicrobium aurantiacum]|uniref:Uncharacterized protein n=1 Tax=Brumimicrobium aurantiacum TaxID=1737063 RepID=A0A3E1F0T4_9FLAO|nr:hypothetical protein DXU93_00325 [Brumimicrobium aurantiacum]